MACLTPIVRAIHRLYFLDLQGVSKLSVQMWPTCNYYIHIIDAHVKLQNR